MIDLITTTPLMEYMDMLYNRLYKEMPRHPQVRQWWIEVRPPNRNEGDDGVGKLWIRAELENGEEGWTVGSEASMHAVEHGARCSASVLETVCNYHVQQFLEGLS